MPYVRYVMRLGIVYSGVYYNYGNELPVCPLDKIALDQGFIEREVTLIYVTQSACLYKVR